MKKQKFQNIEADCGKIGWQNKVVKYVILLLLIILIELSLYSNNAIKNTRVREEAVFRYAKNLHPSIQSQTCNFFCGVGKEKNLATFFFSFLITKLIFHSQFF